MFVWPMHVIRPMIEMGSPSDFAQMSRFSNDLKDNNPVFFIIIIIILSGDLIALMVNY